MEDNNNSNIGRHRLSALANGALIGMGIFTTLSGGQFWGIPAILVGVGIELWQRNRLKKSGF